MNKKTKIFVTQDDIDNGFETDCNNCPIALALQRKFPNKTISIKESFNMEGDDIFQARINEDIFLLPLKAVQFIQRFDNYRSVKPFSFYLTVPITRLRKSLL